MELAPKLRELADRVHGQLSYITTEEATKNALVLPFRRGASKILRRSNDGVS